MEKEELKKLGELVTLYDIEPHLKDIYVEGTMDYDIVKWFVKKHGRNDISVYSIDIVDVSDDKLRYYGLPFPSNRSKVIALSCELSESCKGKGQNILCIVDRDYEDFLPCTTPNPFLKFTDYNSIESYLLDLDVIYKFLSIVLGNLPAQTNIILPQAKEVLKSIFFIRLANENLKWGMNWLDPRRYINITRDLITLDETRFLEAYLIKNSKRGSKEIILSKLAELRSKAKGDERLFMRGHDLIYIFHLIAKKLKNGRYFGDKNFFGGAFFGCLESQDLTKYSLFRNILSM